jgi:hypothetical protein
MGKRYVGCRQIFEKNGISRIKIRNSMRGGYKELYWVMAAIFNSTSL